jgi:hypothetical protein
VKRAGDGLRKGQRIENASAPRSRKRTEAEEVKKPKTHDVPVRIIADDSMRQQLRSLVRAHVLRRKEPSPGHVKYRDLRIAMQDRRRGCALRARHQVRRLANLDPGPFRDGHGDVLFAETDGGEVFGPGGGSGLGAFGDLLDGAFGGRGGVGELLKGLSAGRLVDDSSPFALKVEERKERQE